MAEFDLAGAGGGISSPFGSQGGLTDTAGPTKFREIIKSIGPAIKGLGQAFATMAATGEVSLRKVEIRLDSILRKLNTVNAAMAGTGSGGNVATQALNSSPISGTSGANMPGWGGGIGSDPGGWGSNGGMGFPGMGAGAYFTAQEMGIPTFGQVAAGGGANGGITSGGAGSAASGSNPAFGGYGRPSAGMAAAGLAIAGVGAAGRMGQSMAQQGMSSYQLAFNVSSATGGGLSIAQAAKYANSKLFTGTTGYADTNAAIQTLQGAAGVGVNSPMFNQMARANSALTQFGQSAGVEGASLSNSAQYQAWLLSQQSVGVRGSLGLLGQPTSGLNAFTVASRALSMTNPNLTAAQIGASGQGTPLYAKLLQDSGGDAATAQEMRLYLERQAQVRQKTGKTYNLGGANETASQTAAAQKALGLGQGNPIVQQNIATQQKSQALADASIGAAQAVTKAAEITATALNNLAQSISPGMQNLIGRGAGGAGILGGGIEKGLGLGLGALEISRILKLGSSAGGILGSGARAAATGTSIGSATGALSTTEAAGGAAGAGGLLSALGPIAAVFGGVLGTRALGQYSKTNNGILGKIAGGIADNPLNPLRAASGIDPLTHIAGGLFKSMFGGGAASTSGGGAPTSNLGSGKVSTSPTTTGAAIVRDAEKFLGVPYVWGGTSPHGFDCLARGTLVTTNHGEIPIEDIKIGELVLTRNGYKKVTKAWLVRENAEIVEFQLSNGNLLRGTADHKVWTENRGWTPLGDLSAADILDLCLQTTSNRQNSHLKVKSLSLKESGIIAIQTQLKKSIASIFNDLEKLFIEPCGNQLTVCAHRDMKSIIKTLILSITLLRIWSVCLFLSIGSSRQRHENSFGLFALNAETNFNLSQINQLKTDSVKRIASKNLIGMNEIRIPRADVFDLTVEDEHEFYAEGVLVHNCSGFTQYVYGQMGISIPRTSEQQAQAGLKVPSLASAQQGDLVFYGGNGYDGSPSSPGHVGLYIGNGKMIDAPYPGTNVRVDNVGNPVAIRRYSKGGAGSAVQVGGGGPSSASLLNVKLGSIGGGNTGGGGFGFQLGEGSTGSESASLTAGLTPTMQNGGTTGGGTLGTKNAASSSGSAAASGTGITVGGNVKSWISQAEKITGVGSSWTVGLEEIIQHESSGNPSIINTWDSNAAAGHPSQGLMQLIPSNFKAYAKAPWNKNILDPVSNIVAGIGYIKGKYGSINNVPGVKALSAGQGYVGYEKGSMFIENDDLVKVHKGEMIIRAGAAGAMRMNQLSGPEGGVPGGTKVNFAKGAIAITWSTSSTSSAGISPTSVDTDALADTLQKSIQKKLSIKKISSE